MIDLEKLKIYLTNKAESSKSAMEFDQSINRWDEFYADESASKVYQEILDILDGKIPL